MDLTEVPEQLVVLGGGYIGCELGQERAHHVAPPATEVVPYRRGGPQTEPLGRRSDRPATLGDPNGLSAARRGLRRDFAARFSTHYLAVVQSTQDD